MLKVKGHFYPKTFEKSFASHEKSKYWSSKNEYKSEECCKSSHNKYIFDCNICNHEFEITLNNITSSNQWCSYCTSKNLCDLEDCSLCFNKSFSSSAMVEYWSKKNECTPRQVFKSSNKKYYFYCSCEHEFEISLNSITNNNKWCPYCCIPSKKFCDKEYCKLCFDRSFANSPKAKYWSEKNEISPRDISISNDNKFWFICENNHNFEIKLGNITNCNNWCPFCKNKTERKLYEWLKENYSNVKSQVRFNWCKNIRSLSYDFLLESSKIIIELDGDQHFEDIPGWNSLVDCSIKRDKYKLFCALKNGYSVIRIFQPDVLYDKNDWQFKLELIINCHQTCDISYSLLASNPDIYNNHEFEELDKFKI